MLLEIRRRAVAACTREAKCAEDWHTQSRADQVLDQQKGAWARGCARSCRRRVLWIHEGGRRVFGLDPWVDDLQSVDAEASRGLRRRACCVWREP
jgi:hypothetical protein